MNSDFELFKTECLKWIEIFGLKGWKVGFEHKETNDAYAHVKVDGIVDRFVIFVLNSKPDETDLHYDVKKTAFHEVCELLLWRMEYIGTCRYVQPEELPEERHNIIRILENSFYKMYKESQ